MSRTRIGLALVTALLALLGLLGLATGGPAAASGPAAGSAAIAPSDTAASAVTTASNGQPSPQPSQPTPSASSPSAQPTAGHGEGLAMLRNVLHGEGVLYTEQGQVTVAVQRGAVTSVTDTSLTVRSSDGFSQSWNLPKGVHVIDHRNTVQANGVRNGTQVAVTGSKTGTTYTANLVVVNPAH
jgi:hypothetical protein